MLFVFLTEFISIFFFFFNRFFSPLKCVSLYEMAPLMAHSIQRKGIFNRVGWLKAAPWKYAAEVDDYAHTPLRLYFLRWGSSMKRFDRKKKFSSILHEKLVSIGIEMTMEGGWRLLKPLIELIFHKWIKWELKRPWRRPVSCRNRSDPHPNIEEETADRIKQQAQRVALEEWTIFGTYRHLLWSFRERKLSLRYLFIYLEREERGEKRKKKKKNEREEKDSVPCKKQSGDMRLSPHLRADVNCYDTTFLSVAGPTTGRNRPPLLPCQRRHRRYRTPLTGWLRPGRRWRRWRWRRWRWRRLTSEIHMKILPFCINLRPRDKCIQYWMC